MIENGGGLAQKVNIKEIKVKSKGKIKTPWPVNNQGEPQTNHMETMKYLIPNIKDVAERCNFICRNIANFETKYR